MTCKRAEKKKCKREQTLREGEGRMDNLQTGRKF